MVVLALDADGLSNMFFFNQPHITLHQQSLEPISVQVVACCSHRLGGWASTNGITSVGYEIGVTHFSKQVSLMAAPWSMRPAAKKVPSGHQ